MGASACASTVQQSSSGADSLQQAVSGSELSVPTTGATSPGGTAASALTPPADLAGSTPTTNSLPTATAGATGSGRAAGGTSARKPASTNHTPVEIGFGVSKDVGSEFKALGYSGLSTGDGAQEVRASVALVNSMGGLAGHPIKPIIIESDPESTSATTYQQECSDWFQDNHVAAVVTIAYSPILGACAMQHDVPLLYAALSNSLSAKTLQSAATTIVTDMPTIDVDAVAVTDGLIHQGFFQGSALNKPVVGLLVSDDPNYADVKSIVAQHLQAAGLTLKDTFAMPPANDSSDIAAAATAGQSAALRFKADGINRVVFVSGGFASSWFGVAGRLESYFPRLGLGSMEEPSLEPQVLSAQQLQGAAGIGWDPTLDTPPQYQPALGTHGAACDKALRRGGIDMAVAATRVAALPVCDATLILAAGASPTAYTGPGLLAGIEGLGTSYSSAMNFATDFRSRAVTSQARPLAFNPSCKCFRYTGSAQPLG